MIKKVGLGFIYYFVSSVLLSVLASLPDRIFHGVYQSHDHFFRGEGLAGNQGAIQEAWFVQKIIFALVVAVLYHHVRKSLSGKEWLRGIKFAFLVWSMISSTYLGLWSILDLSALIWLWWSFYFLINSVIGSLLLSLNYRK